MPISHQQLVGLQRAEFANAAWFQGAILKVQIAIALAGAAAITVKDNIWVYLITTIALSLAVVWAWFGWKYKQSRGQAERARRATLLMEGLGAEISASELRSLEAEFTVDPAEAATHEDPNYYAAQAAPGSERLAEMLEETAFFSADLMHHSARRAWMFFIGFLAVGIVLLLCSLPFVAGEQTQNAARIFCALLTLLVSTEILGAAFAYSIAERALRVMVPRLEAIRAAGFPNADLLTVLCDYNSAVESAPMFPPGVYASRRDRLNDLWNKRRPSARGGSKTVV